MTDDCRQSGPCAAKAPGCARHFMERIAELRAEVEHWKCAAKEHAEAQAAAESEIAAARAAVGEAWFVGGVSLAEAIARKFQRLEELGGEREP